MARVFLTVAVIVTLNVLVGCTPVDSGRGTQRPHRTDAWSGQPPMVADAGETDVVEKVAVAREAYRHALMQLAQYYRNSGNHMKLGWAEKELSALNTMAQYNYIIEATVAGPELKATNAIVQADELYGEAVAAEKKAGMLGLKNETQLRIALDKYNELIRKYPSSDKIDDAAYQAAQIYERFKDYTIALVYYQRTYQWDPHTPYPALFHEAYILDQHLHERGKALKVYEKALESLTMEEEHHNWRKYAEKRVAELTKTGEGAK
ncbi:MAG TPA: tetratricopeptide repeat protein [Sedimentisphaerales bacterium]|nr:tetratricopeptide repeat protein [Sedimentisphaerales bacterium]